MNKGRVILLDCGGLRLACNEYIPEDQGRLHILDYNCYGLFNREGMLLDYRKASLTVEEVIYEGDYWPEPIKMSQNADQIHSYFGVDNAKM